ncbi:hypothetical protein D3C76_911990 [compost metagenome]
MPGAANPLQERGDGAGRSDLADQVDIADVDAQLQRGGGHQHLQLAILQPLLGVQAQLLGQAAMVRGDRLLAQPIAEVTGQALGQAPSVDEHQGRAVLAGQCRQAIVDQVPDIRGHDRAQRHWRDFDGQVSLARMTDVDDGTAALMADQKRCHALDRTLRRGQADAPERALAQRLQTLQGQRQMTAALVARHGVNLVDDHRVHAGQAFATGRRAHQNVQRLRGGDQDVRGQLAHGCPFFLRGVAGAHCRGDAWRLEALLFDGLADAFEGDLQVEADVVGQGLERRHVHHLGLGRQLTVVREPFTKQFVEHGEERAEGLARAGRRGQQRGFTGVNQWPGAGLGFGNRGEVTAEPGADGGVEQREHRVVLGRKVHGMVMAGAGTVGKGPFVWGSRVSGPGRQAEIAGAAVQPIAGFAAVEINAPR